MTVKILQARTLPKPHIAANDDNNLTRSSSSNDEDNPSSSVSMGLISSHRVLDDTFKEYLDVLFDDHMNDIYIYIDGNFVWSLDASPTDHIATDEGVKGGGNSLYDFPIDEVMLEFLNFEQS
uniref:uncharacterized protein LOC122610144 n=1 Tax=Erigeron canadensis TaxID=72917 RepID=UPI001CB88BA4|nr:uncharacterized protein LOC122610144 [Erigeron canadensis]